MESAGRDASHCWEKWAEMMMMTEKGATILTFTAFHCKPNITHN